ncbi:MAG: hypothetical protein ACLGIJ_10400 [Candidatus Limnocylindria bacterium]
MEVDASVSEAAAGMSPSALAHVRQVRRANSSDLPAPLPLIMAIALLAVACAPSGAAGGPDTAVAPAATPATIARGVGEPTTGSTAASPSPSATAGPHGDVLTLDASIGYSGLREWMTIWGGIALVEITEVGPIRWDTESGARPDEALIHSAPVGHQDTPGIGRLVEVRRDRLLSGRWLGTSELARYWRPGGRVGADEMINDLGLPPLATGTQAIAFLLRQPGDVGSQGTIPVEVGWLFPVDASGGVITLDPNEKINVDDVESFLP